MPELHTLTAPFAERVRHTTAGPCSLYVLPTAAERIVSFAGSIRTTPDFADGGALVQDLMVQLLDKGTKKRDRFAIADLTDNRGAQVQFRSSRNRITFSGRVLREDLDEVLALVAEQLREPLFDPEEARKAKARIASDIRRSMEETGSQASSALTRQIFPPDHPNYQFPPEAELEALDAMELSHVVDFHRAHVGARELTLVMVGDLDGYDAKPIVSEVFSDWPAPTASGSFEKHGIEREPDRIAVPVPDKQNVDVRMGHALRLRRDDAAYLPLFLGNFVLGGNFSARLMTVVRDKLGLTYGINAGLAGVSTEFDGYWRTAVTLSPENVERGIEATQAEILRLVEDGVTEDEVDAVQTTITGSFKVDLATTGGLAFSILINVLRGFGVAYLDDFPRLVERVTKEEIDEALRRHLRPDAMHVVLAGAA